MNKEPGEKDGNLPTLDSLISSTGIRKILIPEINIHAKAYHCLSSLDMKNMQLPLALKDMTNLKTDDFLHKKLTMEYLCHNQTGEHHIELVTEASASVVGFKERDGVIRQKI